MDELSRIFTHQVARHEDHGELIVVLVVATPNGIVLLIKFLPEIRNGLVFIVVGIESFEVIHVKVAFGQSSHRIFFFWLFQTWHLFFDLRSSLFLLFLFLLRLLLLFGLLSLLFVLFTGGGVSLGHLGVFLGIELSHFFGHRDGAQDLLDLRLVHNSGKPSINIAKRLPIITS